MKSIGATSCYNRTSFSASRSSTNESLIQQECMILFDSIRKEIELHEENYIETESMLMSVYKIVMTRLEKAKHQLEQSKQSNVQSTKNTPSQEEIWIDYAIGLMDVISDMGNHRSYRNRKMQKERENLVERQYEQVMSIIATTDHSTTRTNSSSSTTAIRLVKDQHIEQNRIIQGEMKIFKKEQQFVVRALDTIRRTLLSKRMQNIDELVELGCKLNVTKSMGDERATEYSIQRERAHHHFSYLLEMIRDISDGGDDNSEGQWQDDTLDRTQKTRCPLLQTHTHMTTAYMGTHKDRTSRRSQSAAVGHGSRIDSTNESLKKPSTRTLRSAFAKMENVVTQNQTKALLLSSGNQNHGTTLHENHSICGSLPTDAFETKKSICHPFTCMQSIRE